MPEEGGVLCCADAVDAPTPKEYARPHKGVAMQRDASANDQ